MSNYPSRGQHGRIVRELGIRILSGELAPGMILDLEELSSQYGVSRTVMREAVKVVAGKGLVDSVRRRGTFVQDQSQWYRLDPDVLRWQFETAADVALFRQLNEVRLMIEPTAAALAAERRTEDDLDALGDALALMAQHQPGSDVTKFIEADLAFHSALLKATHNDLAASLSVVIEIGLATRDTLIHSRPTPTRESLRAHRRVLDSVVARDPEEAERRMCVLLASAASDLIAALEQDPGPTLGTDLDRQMP